MHDRHDKLTIASMAILASLTATLLHEGLGHGVTAWLRGDGPTQITSNHLSTLRPDRWVDAAGTLVNLFAGVVFFALSRRCRTANPRFFCWLCAALNLLPGAGYFLFSGALGVGDWQAVISGSPHQAGWRTAMVLGGAALYFFVVRSLGRAASVFVSPENPYKVVAWLPYFVAGVFSCLAGLLDPLGWRLLILSTIPAAFGGSSGLLWADNFLVPAAAPWVVARSRVFPVAAAVLGLAYIIFLGRGIALGPP